MKRLLVWLLVCGILAILGPWLARPRPTVEPVSLEGMDPAFFAGCVGEESEAALEPAPDPAPVAALAETVATRREAQQRTAQSAIADAWIEVEVRDEETGEPVADVRCFLDAKYLPADAYHRFHPDSARTDAHGKLRLRAPAGVGLTVHAHVSVSQRDEQQLAPLAAGEARAVALELSQGGPKVAYVLARDARSGAILEQASIAAGAAVREIVRQPVAAPGLHKLRCAEWTYVKVEAAGYSPESIQLEEGHGSPDMAQVVSMDRFATLNVIVRGPEIPAEVLVKQEWTPSVRSESDEDGIFPEGPVRARNPQRERSARLDGQGRVELEELRAGVGLEPWAESGSTRFRLGAALVLEPGERREVVYDLSSLYSVHGRLIDERGEPVAERGLWVCARDPEETGHATLRIFDGWEPRLWARTGTDEDGRFELPPLPAGNWWIGPRRLTCQETPRFSRSGAAYSEIEGFLRQTAEQRWPGAVSCLARLVKIAPEAASVPLELVCTRELYIRGTLAGRGESRPRLRGNAALRATSVELAGTLPACWSFDGFEIGPLEPGDYRLEWGEGQSRIVRAGTLDLLLPPD